MSSLLQNKQNRDGPWYLLHCGRLQDFLTPDELERSFKYLEPFSHSSLLSSSVPVHRP